MFTRIACLRELHLAKFKGRRFKEKAFKQKSSPDYLNIGVRPKQYDSVISYNSEDFGIPRRSAKENLSLNRDRVISRKPLLDRKALRKMLGI